jgi:hypothetical protein
MMSSRCAASLTRRAPSSGQTSVSIENDLLHVEQYASSSAPSEAVSLGLAISAG